MTFRYRNSSGAHTFDTDLGASVVRLGSITSGFADAAELGEPATGGVEIDDPGGSLDILPLQYIVVVESECDPADDVVTLAVINQERLSRGDSSRPSLVTGADRQWSLDLMDPNEFLGFRLLHSFSRPAEAADARLAALLAVSNCPVHDLGRVVYPTHAMDKCDYTWQDFKAVLQDIAAQAGFNPYAYYDQSAGQFGLSFDDPDSASYTCTAAAISNVLSDLATPGTYPPMRGTEAVLARDPSRIASTAVVQYSGGTALYYDSATADTYTAIDRVAPSSNIKSAGPALAVATKFQRASRTPSDRISVQIRIPRANVNDIRQGHRMQARFSHLGTSLRDYSAWTWFRVMRRVVMQPEETDQTYVMALELTPQKPIDCELDPGIPLTPAGTHPPLGGTTTDASGIVWYSAANADFFSPNHLPSGGPYPGETCAGFGFAAYGVTGGDAGGVNVKSVVRFVFVGPGTMVADWSDYDGTYFVAWEQDYYGPSGPGPEQSGDQDMPGTLTVTVGDLPADATSCYRYIDMTIYGGAAGHGGYTGSKGVFGGLHWAPA